MCVCVCVCVCTALLMTLTLRLEGSRLADTARLKTPSYQTFSVLNLKQVTLEFCVLHVLTGNSHQNTQNATKNACINKAIENTHRGRGLWGKRMRGGDCGEGDEGRGLWGNG